MATDIKLVWETYTARSVFLMSQLLRIGAELDDEDCAEYYGPGTKADGRALAWHSVAVKNVLASLLLIDLASILEDALAVVLDGKPEWSKRGKKKWLGLDDRLQWAREVDILLDFDELDALRLERVRVAHKRHTTEWTKLRRHEFFVRRQLDEWGLIPDVETFDAALSIGDWEEQSKVWKREIWAGVDAASGARAWGFLMTETARKEPDITRPEHSHAFGYDETPAQWYTTQPLDDAVTSPSADES